jgi:nitrate/nitrite transporter NarK
LRRLAAIAFCYGANQLCLMTFVVTLLVVERGFGLAEAGAALAAMQVFGALARIAWGAIADRVGDGFRVLALIALVMIPAALALALLGPASPRPLLWLALLAYAVSAIGWNGVFTAEVARRAPAGQIGAATGGVLFFAFFGTLVGPSSFAAAYQFVGSYGATYGLLSVVAAAGLAAAWSGRRA